MFHSLSFQVQQYMKNLKILIKGLILVFIAMNTIAAFHAYSFTHVIQDTASKTLGIEELSTFEKIQTVIFGVTQPKPKVRTYPSI